MVFVVAVKIIAKWGTVSHVPKVDIFDGDALYGQSGRFDYENLVSKVRIIAQNKVVLKW